MRSLSERENKNLYFRFKGKYGMSFHQTELNEFCSDCVNWVQRVFVFDTLVIPETSNENFIRIAKALDEDFKVLKKNSAHQIIENVSKSAQRDQRKALLKLKGTSFKMAECTPAIRSLAIDNLFATPEFERQGKILFLDDAAFSGSTMLAASKVLGSDAKFAALFGF